MCAIFDITSSSAVPKSYISLLGFFVVVVVLIQLAQTGKDSLPVNAQIAIFIYFIIISMEILKFITG